eukprot:CAMPEP_0116037636 /NCGR_PEP_ID=MMETSP0321-20121206/22196_1 /TAXON_ID=163516 /ORGANISM="Leptocylindrus danicus var. danicus, Strain B650" /LENGTH=279 /DNA_ID=CAMNT_0003515927 /DNA_START=88 /DNA_END=924 /DNA_ORIENTATION=-
MLLVPLAAVYQERKLWLGEGLQPLTMFGMLKVYIYNLVWFSGSFFGCVALLFVRPFINISSLDYGVNAFVERAVGKMCTAVCGPVEVRGVENLPLESEPCIFAANHASQLDIGASYYLDRRYKWISKRSVVYMPGVGMVMILGRHLLLDRKGKSSIKRMYEQANYWLSSQNGGNGCPIFIFPQGTRCMSNRLPFKDGAFNMAINNEVPIVPISLSIPNNWWNDFYPFVSSKRSIVMTIHKPISVTKDTDKERLREECSKVVYSVLPPVPERTNKNKVGQ